MRIKKKFSHGIGRFIAAFLAVMMMSVLFVACGEDIIPTDDAVFTLDKTSVELTVGGNVEVLTLTIAGVEETPQWSSSDGEIATVKVGSSANKATVSGVAEGTALITARAGTHVAVCSVTVKKGFYLNLNKTSVSLMAGTTAALEVDTNVTGSLSFASDKPEVANVNQSGLITAVSSGTATITVSGGNLKAECKVTVSEPYVTVKDKVVLLTLKDGENTYQTEAESNGKVTYASSDPSVATVDEDGLVTAVSEGETEITVRYSSASATFVVKVKGEILKVTLGETVKELEPKGSFTLTATVSPEQTGDDAKIKYEVISGEDIVSVDENGVVTSLGDVYGEAVVRASSVKDPDAYADCTVTVPDPYADWIAISDKASLEAAFKQGNESKKMYLAGDIDLDGADFTSTLGHFNGVLDGRGYEIMNFKTSPLFAGIVDGGVIKNLAVTCTLKDGADNGLLGLYIGGAQVTDCIFDITLSGTTLQPALIHHDLTTAKMSNVIVLARAAGASNKSGAFYLNAQGTMENVFGAVLSGNANMLGATRKTEEELKSAATFEGWDEDVWTIEEGAFPTLKNGGNIGALRVTIAERELTVHSGDTAKITAEVKPVKLPAADKGLTYSSSDETVASVDNSGVVTAHKEGTAVITATSEKDPNVSASITVTVDEATVITLTSSDAVTLEIGAESDIAASVNRGELIYESGNTDVARVDEDGHITAIAAGTAQITVTSTASANKSVMIAVTVMPELVMSIDGESERSMEIGRTLTLELVTNREDDSGVWSSSDEEVATVDGGTVAAIKAGVATITYTSSLDAKKYVSVRITVQPEIEISVIETLTIKTDTPTKLSASVSRGGVTYSSSNPETVSVDENGNLTGLKEGTATVTATSVIDPSKSADCVVTVSNEAEVQISLDKSNATLDWEEQITLNVTVNVPGVVWSSSDEEVATVADGVVTALKKDGTAIITVTSSEDETKTAACTVVVAYVNPEINITRPNKESETLEIGETLEIEYTVSKGDAEITLEGDTAALKLEGNTLTAISAGTVTVKITSSEREQIQKTFTVKVLPTPSVTITNKAAAGEGLKIGTDLALTAVANREDGEIAFASSDESVATVGADGLVTAVSEGVATITATFTTAAGRKVTDSVEITVYDEAILELAHKARSVAVGATYKIEGTVIGATAAYESSDETVATVDESGTVRAIKTGKTTITVSAAGKSVSMVIAVYEKEAGFFEVSTVEQFLAITGANKYYLVNDIDFAGKEYEQGTFGTMVATIRGQGYAIKNLTINLSGTDVGFIDQTGNGFNMQGVNFINMTIKGDAIHGGFVKLAVGDMTIANCYFDVNMEIRTIRTGVIGMMDGNSTLRNCIFDIRYGEGALNPNANENPRAVVGRKCAAKIEKCFVNRTVLGDAYGKVYAVSGMAGGSEQLASAFKTEDELKAASLYDETWEEYWVIENGRLPVLKGALVIEPVKVKAEKEQISVYVGETDKLEITVLNSSMGLTYSSSDESVATVDPDGTVHAVKAGSAVITATSIEDDTKSAQVGVEVLAITVEINPEDVITQLRIGGEKTLRAIVNRGDVVWETSDAEVATVSENGLVTAVAAGNVTITARSVLDGTVAASLDIEVSANVVVTVTLDKEALTLDRDDSETITATVLNSDAGVTYSSSDESVASVDNSGVVTTHDKDGEAVITVTTLEGDASATCAVTVTYIPVVITLTSDSYNVFSGTKFTAEQLASVNKGGITLSVKEGDAVTVENNVVKAVKDGTATVELTSTVSYADVSAVKAEVTITVVVPQTKMSIDVTRRSLHVGGVGAPWSLQVKLDPMPEEPAAGDIVWTSSNEAAVTVSGGYSDGIYYGNLKTVSVGKATITATYTLNGADYTATCEIDSFTAEAGYNPVYSVAGFKNIATVGARWYLANDLDFEGVEITENYVGNMINVRFDGRGYAIKNVKTKFSKAEQGFIWMFDGGTVMENVNFVGFDIGADENIIFGGLIYNLNGGSTLRNCYFEGVISAPGNPNEAFFGAIGVQWNSTITNCVFNVGLAEGYAERNKNAAPRAMIGRWIMGTTENCVAYASTADGKMHAAPGDGGAASDKYVAAFKTDEELMSAATFDGWDAEVWLIEDGKLPRLRGAF